MAAIELKGLTKRFGETVAVRELSLSVADGEFLVLVGPSGCGKTTVLRILAGLEEPDSGDILIGDRLVNDVAPKDRDIAMVFQSYALYPHMTAFDNIAFGLKVRRTPKDEVKRRVEEAAEMLGVGHLLSRRPKELSGGERQRVALGRAIVRQPRAFLMDEPLSNLDAKLRLETRAELIRLHSKLCVTTFYVTHDQAEAMTMAQRIAVMKDGVLQQVGTPQEVYDNPANTFVGGFMGSPAMNFLPGKTVRRDSYLVLEADGITIPLPPATEGGPDDVIAGFRPEHVELGPGDGGGPSFEATVDVAELMGATAVVYLKAGGNTVVATVPGARMPGRGETVSARVGREKVRLFDPATGAALGIR
jgi:multiple sugar transport system ATP-binding protein